MGLNFIQPNITRLPTAIKPADCFSIKRLVRDYGKTSSDVSFGKLSISGNVSLEDVFIRITNPHTSYRLDIVKSLFLEGGFDCCQS